MKRPRLVRGLRIAVSAVCGVLCVLLVVLWVRSYQVVDAVSGTRGPKSYYGGAYKGEVGLSSIIPVNQTQIAWDWFTEPIDSRQSLFSEGVGYRIKRIPGIQVAHFGNGWHLVVSLWLPIMVSLSLAGVIWVPGRFSLRTMLIAITLIAAVLGWIGYALQ